MRQRNDAFSENTLRETMNFAYSLVVGLAVIEMIKASIDGCGLNEAGVSVCSQQCVERLQQYTCSCLTGYVLADDNQTCLVAGEEPILVIVSGKEVNAYYTETGDIEPLTKLPDSHVTAIGFGPGNTLLLVSDHGTVVYRTSLDGGKTGGEPEPLIDTGLKYVASVAVDWVTYNIYLVDSVAGTVIVCTWTADNCSVLIRDLRRPFSAVVNIKSKKLLWTEWGMSDKAGSINSADLDGSQHSVLLDGLDEPRNLVLDTTVGTLYWVAKSHTRSGYMIQSMKINSEQKKVHVISNGLTAPRVSVLSNQLYVTEGNSTVVINKFTGQVLGNKDLDTESVTMAAVYHPVLYDMQGVANACDSVPCSHLCVPSNSNHGYRCLCPAAMELDAEGKCTRKEDDERLLVSGMTGIYEIPKEFIGNHDNQGQRLLDADVNCIVYDSVEGRLFYYDDSSRAIQMIQLQSPQFSSLLYKQTYPVEGMAHDPSSRIIYWTTTQGKVYAGKEDGTFSLEIITGLKRPRGITVDSENGYIYICDWGSLSKILRCHMDGTYCHTFIHVDRGHPNMVVIASPLTAVFTFTHDQNKALYWTDSEQDLIGYTSLDGVKKGEILLNHSKNLHPYSLVVTDSTIFFTDLNTRHVHYIEKADVSVVKDLHLSTGSLYGLDHVQKSTNVPNTACSVDNGGCTHLCLVKPEGLRTCLCPNNEGNTSCTVEGQEMPHTRTTSSVLHRNYIRKSRPVERKDSLLLVIVLVTGVVVLLLVISVIVFCYHRNKQHKGSWMLRFVRYMKYKQTEDVQGLVSDSTLYMEGPNFKQFDNIFSCDLEMSKKKDINSSAGKRTIQLHIDYPEDQYCFRSLDRRSDGRETSMISADSAFTEMKDFDIYSSVDNL